MLKRQNGVRGLLIANSKDSLAGLVGALSIGVGQHGLELLCEMRSLSIGQARAGGFCGTGGLACGRASQSSGKESWEEEKGLDLHDCGVVGCLRNKLEVRLINNPISLKMNKERGQFGIGRRRADEKLDTDRRYMRTHRGVLAGLLVVAIKQPLLERPPNLVVLGHLARPAANGHLWNLRMPALALIRTQQTAVEPYKKPRRRLLFMMLDGDGTQISAQGWVI